MEAAAEARSSAGAPLKDELCDKCQKLFLEFLQDFQSRDGEMLYMARAEDLIRPERNTLTVNFGDLEQYNQQLATTIQEEFYRVYPYLCRAVCRFARDHGNVPASKEFYVGFSHFPSRQK